MVRLVKIRKSRYAKKTTAPGKAILLKTIFGGAVVGEPELYHPPGVISAPTDGDAGVEVGITSGGKIIVGTHNYRIELEPSSGETILYSTNAAGDTVQAQIKLDASGNIDLNGDGKTFVTHAELDSALQTFITALNAHVHPVTAVGSPTGIPVASMSIDISAAETTTVRTDG